MHDIDTVLWNAIILGYAQNKYVERAHKLFDKIPHRDAILWTAMILRYA